MRGCLHCFAMNVQGTKAKVVFEGASRLLQAGENLPATTERG